MHTERRRSGDWSEVILPAAARIVESYDTPVSLRQLFYRLVSAGLIRNTQSDYQQLSHRSAACRRDGRFPALIDQGRGIVRPEYWLSPEEARQDLRDRYRRDRTEGQEWTVCLGVEKRGIVEQLYHWFGDERGLPILPLGGFSSESFEAEVNVSNNEHDRGTVLLYAGDLDPEGEAIEANFTRFVPFTYRERVALTLDQVEEYELPPMPGKPKSAHAGPFIAKYGSLFQIELDALDPNVLRDLFIKAIAPFWDEDAYAAAMEREQAERETL
jgi:hypothetical protein